MKYKNDLKRRVLAGLFAGAALYTGMAVQAAGPAADIIANDTLPQGPHSIVGGHEFTYVQNRPILVVHQEAQNGVIKWDSFNVGANAAVTFEGDKQGFNTLNYVSSGNGMSQIYGAIDATNGGNIYIVNPAGVEIGSSAQINVGSLYVSNRNLDDKIYEGIQSRYAAFISGRRRRCQRFGRHCGPGTGQRRKSGNFQCLYHRESVRGKRYGSRWRF